MCIIIHDSTVQSIYGVTDVNSEIVILELRSDVSSYIPLGWLDELGSQVWGNWQEKREISLFTQVTKNRITRAQKIEFSRFEL